MLSSQMVQDEKLHEQYLRIVQGRSSVTGMISPFKKISFHDYFEHFSRCYKEYSGQNKKAEAMLAFLYALSDLWFCELPERRAVLLNLPHVGSKKTAVTLNACGFYRNVGAGADIHCFKCFRYLVKKCCTNEQRIDKKIQRLFLKLPANPGRDAK